MENLGYQGGYIFLESNLAKPRAVIINPKFIFLVIINPSLDEMIYLSRVRDQILYIYIYNPVNFNSFVCILGM
jgi:hypothetical protein